MTLLKQLATSQDSRLSPTLTTLLDITEGHNDPDENLSKLYTKIYIRLGDLSRYKSLPTSLTFYTLALDVDHTQGQVYNQIAVISKDPVDYYLRSVYYKFEGGRENLKKTWFQGFMPGDTDEDLDIQGMNLRDGNVTGSLLDMNVQGREKGKVIISCLRLFPNLVTINDLEKVCKELLNAFDVNTTGLRDLRFVALVIKDNLITTVDKEFGERCTDLLKSDLDLPCDLELVGLFEKGPGFESMREEILFCCRSLIPSKVLFYALTIRYLTIA